MRHFLVSAEAEGMAWCRLLPPFLARDFPICSAELLDKVHETFPLKPSLREMRALELRLTVGRTDDSGDACQHFLVSHLWAECGCRRSARCMQSKSMSGFVLIPLEQGF